MINNNKLEKNNKISPELSSNQFQEIINLTEIEIGFCKEAFQIFDKHSSGLISTKELILIINSLGLILSEEDFQEIINKYDNEINNNLIDFNTFIIIYSKIKEKNEKNKEKDLIEAFKIFDKENNGKINAQELKYVMMTSGEDFNENYIKDLINECLIEKNNNNDNTNDFIDYKKFVKLLISYK